MTTALITGASRGMGALTARRLAERGTVVFAGMRRPAPLAGCTDVNSTDLNSDDAGLDIRPLELDVTDDASVASAAAQVADSVGALDILINNAGIPGSWAPAEEIGPADFQAVLETNLLGPVRVTRAFLPLLRRGQNPRLVMISSGMGSLGLQTSSEDYGAINHLPYPASKAALNMVAVQYAKSLPDVIVTSIDPGLTATEFTDHTGHSVWEGTDAAVAAALDTNGPSGRFLDRTGSVVW